MRSLVLDIDSSVDENINIKLIDLDIEIAKRVSGLEVAKTGLGNYEKATDIKNVGVLLKTMLNSIE
jgi:hypothetical protein